MDILPLNPLPAENSEHAKGSRRIQSEGFVDEEIVRSVVLNGAYERVYVKHEDMVLSSSVDDYAGWALPVSSPFRDLMGEVEEQTQAPSAEVRQPGAPVLRNEPVAVSLEVGIAEPYSGGHRWWLFGLSGALTCAVLSLTLLSLAERGTSFDPNEGYVPMTLNENVESAESLATNPPTLQSALTSVISDN